MSLSVTDLFTATSAADIRQSMVDNLVAVGVPADQWVKGGVASTMLTVISILMALTSSAIASIINGFFLPTATGISLKLLATYMYGITLPEATFASGNVVLTNTGGGSYSQAIGSYTALNPTTKVTYTNSAAFTLAPSSTATVPMTATTVGSAGNAAPGAINTNVTSLLGVTVTNPAALAGVDAPSDASIRTLCINKLGALSVRGVRTAYAYAVQTALNSTTGAPVNINRWSISAASHTGTVTTYVASPSGVPATDDVTGVATNIELIARPEAVTAIVTAATALSYAPTVVVWASLAAGTTATDAKTAIDAALITFIATYPIGGVLATDDANPSSPIQGLFGAGVYGIIAEAIADLGGKMLSAQGATDLVLTAAQVATNSITTSVRVIAPTSGTTVS